MSRYQVPRQVTTRLEFVPGFGLRETAGTGVGVAIGFVLYKLASLLGAPFGVPALLLALPTALACVAMLGGENSLYSLLRRVRWFKSRSQRMLFKTGSGGRRTTTATPVSSQGSPSIKGALQGMLAQRRGSSGPPPSPQQAGSVQEWFPIHEVTGGVVQRRDGGVVAVIQVDPVNLGLKSPAEQERILNRLHEAVNALQQPAQILSIPRPLDLDAYVSALVARHSDLDARRQRLLNPYIQYVMSLVSEGEAQERRYYILLPQTGGRGAAAQTLQAAHDLVARLRQAELNATVLDDLQLMDLLYVWCNPVQAAFER